MKGLAPAPSFQVALRWFSDSLDAPGQNQTSGLHRGVAWLKYNLRDLVRQKIFKFSSSEKFGETDSQSSRRICNSIGFLLLFNEWSKTKKLYFLLRPVELTRLQIAFAQPASGEAPETNKLQSVMLSKEPSCAFCLAAANVCVWYRGCTNLQHLGDFH